MMFKTHVVAGVLTGIGTYTVLAPNTSIADNLVVGALSIGGAMFGSMFPDIDTENSKLGRRIPLIPTIISTIFGHRGMTHSLFFGLVVSALFWYLGDKYIDPSLFNYLVYGIIAFFVGFVSHLVLDIITKERIPLFYPFQSKKNGYALGLVRTNGVRELIFRWLMILGSIYLFFKDYL